MDVTGRVDPDPERTSDALPHPGLRLRVVAAWHRWVRFGPWLVPIGALLTVWALSVSVLAGAIGAALVGVGVSASLWHPRLRRTQARASSTRRTRSSAPSPRRRP
jgi:hypothetical protein